MSLEVGSKLLLQHFLEPAFKRRVHWSGDVRFFINGHGFSRQPQRHQEPSRLSPKAPRAHVGARGPPLRTRSYPRQQPVAALIHGVARPHGSRKGKSVRLDRIPNGAIRLRQTSWPKTRSKARAARHRKRGHRRCRRADLHTRPDAIGVSRSCAPQHVRRRQQQTTTARRAPGRTRQTGSGVESTYETPVQRPRRDVRCA